jgi:hypothetical protein
VKVIIVRPPERFRNPSEDEHMVWVGLDDVDPITDIGFCIGTGKSRAEAIVDARNSLTTALEDLGRLQSSGRERLK